LSDLLDEQEETPSVQKHQRLLDKVAQATTTQPKKKRRTEVTEVAKEGEFNVRGRFFVLNFDSN
jgi:hypothetical protein